MYNTTSELYTDLLQVYSDEYIGCKYDPANSIFDAYSYDPWFVSEVWAEKEESTDKI